MFFFHHKREVISRSYDVAGTGYSPLPARAKIVPVEEQQKFCWTVSLAKDLAAIFSSIFLSAVGYGILLVLIALQLEQHVKNEVLMSLSAATQIGAGVIFSRFLPSLGKKAGMINSIYAGTIISAIGALVVYVYPGYILWLLTIFALGTSFFICGVTRNTIMIDLAPSHMRAMIISLGTMTVAIGNSLGPIILKLLQTGSGLTSSIIACLFYLFSMFPLSRLRRVDANIREQKKISLWRYIKTSPKIMFAGFSVSYAMSSSSAFLIIYGIQSGMEKGEASLLLSVLLFGTIFSIPIGYLADRFNRRMLMIISAVISLYFAYSLFINTDLQKIYSLLFLMFGFLSGIKLPAAVLINEKYKPTQRLAVNSAFARFSLTGNVTGLLCTGFIMKQMGPQGLWASVMIILFLFLSFCCVNYWKKILNKEFKKQDLSIFNKKITDEQLLDI